MLIDGKVIIADLKSITKDIDRIIAVYNLLSKVLTWISNRAIHGTVVIGVSTCLHL